MQTKTTTHAQDIFPMLDYEDGLAAMEWLTRAFDFREVTRMLGSDGRLSHGQMIAGASDGHIMLASAPPGYQSPKRVRENYPPAREWLSVPWVVDGVLVYVDDVDAHFARAKAAGATILSEPEDGFPARRYRVEDIEGHRWMFMQPPSAETQ